LKQYGERVRELTVIVFEVFAQTEVLANVSQDDISAFQGRAPFSMDTEGTPLQVPMTEQWESFEDSVLYGMMDKCFCKELAMQTSTKWMSSAHVTDLM
jgi:hypothetical protein